MRNTLQSSRQTKAADKLFKVHHEQRFAIYDCGDDKNSDDTASATATGTKSLDILLFQHKKADAITATTRRLFFGSALIAAGTSALGDSTITPANAAVVDPNTRLWWQVSPVNKRTGVTVFDAEQTGYKVNFVTYLSRFLLVFDLYCQRWWLNKASDIPRTATAEEVARFRNRQFGAFSASVEVGLQEYGGDDGPKRLLEPLLKRDCPDLEKLQKERETKGKPPFTDTERARQEREIKEARRQICLLFGLMETNQPVDGLTQQLAAIDNGLINKVQLQDPGSGYAPGYGAPEVRFPPPEAGEGYQTATGRAILSPNGKLLRIDVVNRCVGYNAKQPPTVTVSPPAAIRFEDFGTDSCVVGFAAEAAAAQAFVFRSGPNKGWIERLQLTKPGAGYRQGEIIRIRISPPDLPKQKGGVTATATAVLESEVSEIQIVNNGTSYAVEKPIQVYVEPPPLTARVNMNDPMMARIVKPDEPLPATSIPTTEMRKKMPSAADPQSVSFRANFEAGKGGAGGCIGRACYDRPVVAVAYPTGERTIFKTFRKASDDNPIEDQRQQKTSPSSQRIVSGASAGDLPETALDIAVGGPTATSSSSELLTLLPAGIGLEFNALEKRYELAVDPNFQEGRAPRLMKVSARKIDPDFGPRGRAPIEREMQLGVSSYLRFILSGAICGSGVHLALTPIDVVKTKVQTDPEKYPGMVKSFKLVYQEDGVAGFIRGWAPTFLGFFVWGGTSYASTEFVRQTITEYIGTAAIGLEVPLVLFASALGAFAGSFTICPFESVRIQTLSQPNYAPNILGVLNRMVDEEGVMSLFQAVPVFLAKEVPFAMAKFTVFDLSTAWMYSQFPAAKEDLQLSLFVSLLGGTLGGIAAAIVSNPADVTIS